MEFLTVLKLICSTSLTAFFFRFTYLIFRIYITECNLHKIKYMRTLFCIGSGSHATELLRIVSSLNFNIYKPRLYVLADNDVTSEAKIKDTENGHQNHSIQRIPRSRNVNQYFITSIFTTFYAALCTIPVIYKYKPNLIFCNGLGICIPMCIVAFLMRCFFILDCKIVCVENRVKSLSRTGKILEYFVDLYVLQMARVQRRNLLDINVTEN